MPPFICGHTQSAVTSMQSRAFRIDQILEPQQLGPDVGAFHIRSRRLNPKFLGDFIKRPPPSQNGLTHAMRLPAPHSQRFSGKEAEAVHNSFPRYTSNQNVRGLKLENDLLTTDKSPWSRCRATSVDQGKKSKPISTKPGAFRPFT